ncbi:MAG: hypothetical protein D6731_10650 [Planctomycetota bacterium]|nr:MAG: hypothetical protein D6731_10650 [Planctomycetota bacterium]
MIWVIGAVLAALVAGSIGLAYLIKKAPPKALVGLTAAGAVVVVPYAVWRQGGVELALDPSTGASTVLIDGVGVGPSGGGVVVGGVNTATGMPHVVLHADDEHDVFVATKRPRARKELEDAGFSTQLVDIEAPEGFQDDVAPALVVRPAPGDSPEETLRRVGDALRARGIETTRFVPNARGLAGALRR